MTTATTELTAKQDIPTISLVSWAHGTSHFFHLMLPSLFPFFIRDFGLSYTEVGLLMTVFFVASGVGQALSGFVVDRLGAARVLYGGMAFLALSGLAVFLANSYHFLMVAAFLAGSGNAVFHPVDYSILNRRVSRPRLAHAFSMHSLAGNLGWAAAPPLMLGVASMANWHVAGLVASAIALGTLALLISQRHLLHYELITTHASRGQPSVERQAPNQTANRDSVPKAPSLFAFMKVRAVWMSFAFFFFSTTAFGALQNYVAPLLSNLYGLSLTAATACLTGYLLGSSAGVVVGGFMASKARSHGHLIAAALAVGALMAALVATGVPPAWSVIALLTIMGFGVGVASPSRDLMVREAATHSLGHGALGRVYGFVYSGLDTGLALSPLMFGPLMDSAHFSAVLFGVALLQGMAILTALTVSE
jgi:FSR family fosmidomycin resistance protein-like MFS transporter